MFCYNRTKKDPTIFIINSFYVGWRLKNYYLRLCMSYRKFIFGFFILFFIGFSSCEKKSQKIFYYQATQCSDPWGSGTQGELRNKVTRYFSERGVRIILLDFRKNDDLMVCEACGCYSGTEIVATVEKKDANVMIEHGFSEEK